MIKPIICAIAAMDQNRVIGNKNQIPWDIPEDMAYLRETTRGFPLIMGRSTHESICEMRGIDPRTNGAMPGRFNVVVSHQEDYFLGSKPGEFVLANTPQQGLNLAYDFAANAGLGKIFIFGGAKIYAELLEQTERLYLTQIHAKYEGDAWFPEYNENNWQLRQSTPHDLCDFNVYDRIKSGF